MIFLIVQETFNNTYLLYNAFVSKRIDILIEKGEKTLKDVHRITTDISIKRIHQKYALSFIIGSKKFKWFESERASISNLSIFHEVSDTTITNEDVSRIGIITIDADGNFTFLHRTFAEFFVVQYLVDNIYKSVDASNEEMELRIKLFTYLTVYNKNNQIIFKVIQSILKDFLKSIKKEPKKINQVIEKILREKFGKFYEKLGNQLRGELFFEFFHCDEQIAHTIGTIYDHLEFVYGIKAKQFLNCSLTDTQIASTYRDNNQLGKIQIQRILIRDYTLPNDLGYIEYVTKIGNFLQVGSDKTLTSLIKLSHTLTQAEMREMLMSYSLEIIRRIKADTLYADCPWSSEEFYLQICIFNEFNNFLLSLNFAKEDLEEFYLTPDRENMTIFHQDYSEIAEIIRPQNFSNEKIFETLLVRENSLGNTALMQVGYASFETVETLWKFVRSELTKIQIKNFLSSTLR